MELTKCTGAGCPKKASCIRYSIPESGETYFISPWYKTPKEYFKCDYYKGKYAADPITKENRIFPDIRGQAGLY